jgi:hypothetical protein
MRAEGLRRTAGADWDSVAARYLGLAGALHSENTRERSR